MQCLREGNAGRSRDGWLVAGTGTPEGLPRSLFGSQHSSIETPLEELKNRSLLRGKLKG